MGNLTGVTEADNSTVLFGYDALYRLTAEQRTGTAAESHSYGYDPAGNMTSKDGSTTNLSYDAANKLAATSVYLYDKDGDMTSSSPSGASYGWDDRGNMVSRTVSGQVSYAYGYNAQGLRVHSVITPSAQPTTNTFYIYDGSKLLGEVSSAGVVNAVYTWGADGLASERLLPATTARSLFYGFGPQGETRQLTGSTGQVVDSYTYTAWGQALASSGSDTNPFQYGGKFGYYTEYGGMALCGHRWYDTGTLRWLSRDPIGYNGGDNLYAYCGDDPVGETDPSGYRDAGTLPGQGRPEKPTHYKRPGGPYYPGVPIHPAGADILDNIAQAENEQYLYGFDLLGYKRYMHDQFTTGGSWDYKQWGMHYLPPPGVDRGTYEYDDFGNFNYGAILADLGIPLSVALELADQNHKGKVYPGDHGDDWIKKGYEWEEDREIARGVAQYNRQCGK